MYGRPFLEQVAIQAFQHQTHNGVSSRFASRITGREHQWQGPRQLCVPAHHCAFSQVCKRLSSLLQAAHTERKESETYDIYLLPPNEDPETCQSWLRMRNRDGRYNLMFEEWVCDGPFIISPRITFEVCPFARCHRQWQQHLGSLDPVVYPGEQSLTCSLSHLSTTRALVHASSHPILRHSIHSFIHPSIHPSILFATSCLCVMCTTSARMLKQYLSALAALEV